MASQHDESAAIIQREIQETLLDPESFGIELSNRFALLGTYDDREADVPHTPSCTINDLPPEIWHKVFEWAKAPQPKFDPYNRHRAGKPHYKFDTNEEYPLFKTLRLVSKKFHALTSPLLFKSFTLHFHPDSWAKLNNIANSNMATFVHKICLSTIHTLQAFPTEDEWAEAIFDQWTEYAAPWTQRPKGGPYALKFGEYGSWESGWARYQAWKKAEDKMTEHYNSNIVPVLNLQLLTSLRGVETVDQLGVIKRTGHYDEAWEFQEYDLSIREFETLLPNYGVPDFEFEVNERHFDLFGMRNRIDGSKFTELVLRNPRELIGGKANVSFTTLRRLQINLGHCNINRLMASYRSQGLSDWVFDLPLLEEFSVQDQQLPDSDQVDVLALLFAVYWPSLRSLELHNCCVQYRTLMDFVTEHWANLRRFRVELPRGIGKGQWRRFREEMRCRCLMKRDLRLGLTKETWEEEHERWDDEEQVSQAEGGDGEIGDEGLQAGDGDLQADNGWDQDEAPEPESGW